LTEIYEDRLVLPAVEFRSEAQHVLCAFAQTVREYEIPREHFVDLAEGCRMDWTVLRYPTWARLENYCYRVAGVMGLILSAVFGLKNSAAGAQAVKFGNAMRLTRILRDLKADHARGRIYLPLEDMARFRYSERDLAAGRVDEHFRALMKFEIERARGLFREGAEGLCWLADDGSRLTVSAMGVTYAGILSAIERQDYDVFSRRAELTLGRKLGRLPAAWRLANRPDGAPLPDVF
jgi:phytoene synthase